MSSMYRDSAVGRYHKVAQRHNHDALGMFVVVCVRVRDEHMHIQYKQDKEVPRSANRRETVDAAEHAGKVATTREHNLPF